MLRLGVRSPSAPLHQLAMEVASCCFRLPKLRSSSLPTARKAWFGSGAEYTRSRAPASAVCSTGPDEVPGLRPPRYDACEARVLSPGGGRAVGPGAAERKPGARQG